MSIKENIAHITQLKNEAAERSGRKGEDAGRGNETSRCR